MGDYKFKFMDVPDFEESGKKKSSFKLKLILTMAIIVMIFVLFNKQEVKDKIQERVAHNAVSQQLGGEVASIDQETGTRFDRANGITDRKALEVLAQEEADKMMQSGDTHEYHEAISKDKILKQITK